MTREGEMDLSTGDKSRRRQDDKGREEKLPYDKEMEEFNPNSISSPPKRIQFDILGRVFGIVLGRLFGIHFLV